MQSARGRSEDVVPPASRHGIGTGRGKWERHHVADEKGGRRLPPHGLRLRELDHARSDVEAHHRCALIRRQKRDIAGPTGQVDHLLTARERGFPDQAALPRSIAAERQQTRYEIVAIRNRGKERTNVSPLVLG